MKKYLIFALIIICGVSFGHVQNAHANPFDFDRVYMAQGGNASTQTPVATTTAGVTFLSAAATASTTFPFPTNNVDSVSVDINYIGSTTASSLQFQLQASNDPLACNTDPNVCNWFNLVTGSTTPYTISSTTPVYSYTPNSAANATSSINVLLPAPTTRFMRIRFGTAVSNAAIWMEANNKRQRP